MLCGTVRCEGCNGCDVGLLVRVILCISCGVYCVVQNEQNDNECVDESNMVVSCKY